MTTTAAYVTASYTRYLVETSATVADIGQESEIVFVYNITQNVGAVIDYNGADYHAMLTEGVLPNIGETYSSWSQYAPGSVEHPNLKLARCRSINFQSIKQGGGGCNATVVFRTLAAYDPLTYPDTAPQNQADVILQLPSNIEYNASLRSMPLYRKTWTTQPPVSLDETAADIGGTAASANKGNMAVEVPQVRLRLRLIRDATAAKMEDNATIVTGYLNKINTQTFYNFPAGTVICEGFNMIHLNHEYYEVVIDFIYDAYAHHEQVPKMRPDGKIDINSNGDPVEVKWKRVARTGADFNQITAFDANLGVLIARGYWDLP